MPFTDGFTQWLDENVDKFYELHNHSDFSNLRLKDATNKLDRMVKYVRELGMKGMALTDHESLSGHVKFIKLIKELRKEDPEKWNDFKYVLGNEIYLTSQDLMQQQREQGYIKFYHFILLAKDGKGHEQLRRLSSIAWKKNSFNYKGMDRVPTYYSDIEEVIGEDKGHLIATSACCGSYIGQGILEILNENPSMEEQEKIKDDIYDYLMWCQDTFGEDNFYIEMQPSDQEGYQFVNEFLLRIAKACNIPFIFTTDAHYLNRDERQIHKAFLTSDEDGNGNREVDSFYGTTYFMDVYELCDRLSYLNEDDLKAGILNTKKIADSVEEYDLYKPQIVPKVPIPDRNTWFKNDILYNYAMTFPALKEGIESKEPYNNYLINLALEGVYNKIFKGEVNALNVESEKETFERMNIEMNEILGASEVKGEPVSAYLVTEKKNVDIIWNEADSILGTARGSASGYILNYLLGITQINPLVHGDGMVMPYWRFATKERLSFDVMDIDIDIPSHKREKVFDSVKKYYEDLGGTLIRVGTFGTETAKSAVQTACRGLGINSDVGIYLSSLIPVERGKVRCIRDCYYGNEEKGIKPITEFKNQVDEYADKDLLNVMLGVEGLINKRSTHACALDIYGKNEINDCITMKAPSGDLTTQYDLHDVEYTGGLKYDFLNTKTCSMIQVCLELLLKYGEIEWQGTLRKTYDKYLHPDVIDRTTEAMWEKVDHLIGAFQYDTPQGIQAISKIHPRNLYQATSGNTLMRLEAPDGKEQPIDRYARYIKDINEWYKDMKDYGLNDREMEIMKKYLALDYGVCSTQEGMMLLVMEKEISNFTMVEANKIRKGCSKKLPKVIQECKELFYEKGLEAGTREIFLDYVWNEQISFQLNYGFSILHGVAYTYILIQQLNLVYYYNPIYWDTAYLIIESGSLEMEQLENDEEDEEENEDDTNSKDTKEKTTNYGTIASAIGKLQNNGVKIALPDINKAETGFSPDIKNEQIIFGLKGVEGVNNETARLIMSLRPFTSFDDIYNRMYLVKKEKTLSTGKKQNKSLISKTQLEMLIKGGAFDELDKDETREELLKRFLLLLNPPKKSISGKTIEKVIQTGIVPSEYALMIRFYRFRNYIMSLDYMQDEETKSIKWYLIDEDYAIDFFNEHFINDMTEDRDYKYNENGDGVFVALDTKRKGSFEAVYTEKIAPLTKFLNSKECLDLYNQITFDEVTKEKMSGSISKWEMEALNFYYHEHELTNVNKEKYSISNFFELSEEPEVIGYTKYAGKQYPKFSLTRIAGTVLDRDKNKHIVTLLTTDGVVSIKFQQGQFAFYDKVISVLDDETGKKITLEKGWFNRGQKLLITGFRRGDQFRPKRYKNSIYQHSVSKIEDMDNEGNLKLISERVSVEE